MLAFLAFSVVTFGQTPINQARSFQEGTSVTISGRVTNGQELGTIRYVEDETGGLPAFPGTGSVSGFASQVARGDSITVTGVLYDYNGLLELSPVTGFVVHAKGNPLPEPPSRMISDIQENLEGTLARYEAVTFLESGDFKGNTTYTIKDAGGAQADVYVRNGQDIVGQPIPTAPVDLIGILSAYFGYQILPRDMQDIIPATDLFFTDDIRQTDLDDHSVTLQWQTNLSATALVMIEDVFGNGKQETINASATSHTYTIQGLDPATFYRVHVIAERPGSQINSQQRWMSTASLLPGSIAVYFNQPVDQTFAMGAEPITTSGDDILDALIELIQQATQSIDLAIYNVNEDVIVNALNIAKNKGIQVRYVAAEATSNSSLDPPPAFPVIYGNDWALMHNKFVVIDADIPEKAAVFTGSMNFTTSQIQSYPNNMVLIQDHALAKNYTREFEEMWGSQGQVPDPDYARFGSEKWDNTPHLFKVGGSLVESYFSPSDFTNREILDELQHAGSSIRFALLTFTKDDLADAMILQLQNGLEVRGIIENINDNGSEYNKILNAGVNVIDHSPSALMHHKYAILDDQVVITGSHNWSNAADQQNDENTVIIHDALVANQFRQEFEARWGELPVPVSDPDRSEIRWTGTIQSGTLFLFGQGEGEGSIEVELIDMFGRRVSCHTIWKEKGIHTYALSLPALAAGQYLVRFPYTEGLQSFIVPVMW
ncbi:MAG: hypothetical protein K9I85_08825 [Saprospiraceae bacterium]|nr:hypothetical protein [Saprospiraceae bacterium]